MRSPGKSLLYLTFFILRNLFSKSVCHSDEWRNPLLFNQIWKEISPNVGMTEVPEFVCYTLLFKKG